MSFRPGFSVSAALALFVACGEHTPPATGEDGACPLTAPTLLAAAPELFVPQRDTFYDLQVFGDDLLFTFDRPDDSGRVYWRKGLCGGEPERYVPVAPGLHNLVSITTDEGPLLYANDLDDRYYILDRLAVEGADPRREVEGLPRERMKFYGNGPYLAESNRSYVLFHADSYDPDADRWNAAGVGAATSEIYVHAGDPGVPAWHLGDDIVQSLATDDRLLLLRDDGTLEWADPRRSEYEPVLAGVRHFDVSPDGARMLWQAIGDADAEPVYLRELAGDDDLEVAVNDFADLSWQPDPPVTGFVGSWAFTADGAHATLLGPEGTYVAAIRTDTGAPIAIPAHARPSAALGLVLDHVRGLVLADPDDHVEALWDLETGELREWYRGADERPVLKRLDGDTADIWLPDPEQPGTGTLRRVDLVSGESVVLFPAIGGTHVPGEREYLVFTEARLVEAPHLTHGAFYPHDLLAVDVETHALRRLADDVPDIFPVDGGWVYLDLFGDEPGLRAIPAP